MSHGDHIEVRRIRSRGHHGALEGEQDNAQPFEVDLDIYLDLAAAEASDDLSQTLDYATVTLAVVELVATTRFALLEALAGEIAGMVIADGRVDRVEVTLRKMVPPIPADLESVGVHLVRSRR